jgi:DNA-binding NarL/FixJ family response regulator
VIKVLLVDDQALIRAGFRALLTAEEDITVVGEAADGRAGVDLAARYRPDVAFFDVQMPVMDGIEATRRIAADPALTDVRVVILTNYGLDEYVFTALRAGASGFLLKDTEPADLVKAVRIAARGEALLSPGITRRLIAEYVTRPPRDPAPAATVPAGLTPLTGREVEVVTLVGRGLTNEEIAAEMGISPTTAKTHVSRSMTKLGARDRAQVVVYAYETGLVTPGR